LLAVIIHQKDQKKAQSKYKFANLQLTGLSPVRQGVHIYKM